MPSLFRRPVSVGSDPGRNSSGSRPVGNGGRAAAAAAAAATVDAPARGPWNAADPPRLVGATAGPAGDTAAPAAGDTLDPAAGIVRYRGFLLMPQGDRGWLVRPERSPMTVLPFRTASLTLSDVKALVDGRLRAIRQASQS
ncbi:MAG: hypothetical protein VKJ44_10630 [Synechococcus sp.]|nr:hypothetical protein [Synechococcus sp.]